jgi:hypothetical protein
LQPSLPTLHAVTTDFKPGYQDVKLTVPFHLSLHPIEQVAFEFLHAPAPQARHVHVITLRTPLVEVALALYMQQVELVHQSLPL